MSQIYESNNNYDEIINDGLVLIDFFATWCGPCKMLAPILESLENVKVVKIDVDKFPDLAKREGILSIPTLLLFNNGELKSRYSGFMPKEQLDEWIDVNK